MKTSGKRIVPKRAGLTAAAGAAAAAHLAMVMPSFGGTTGSAVTVSFSGSTALRNWFVVKTTTFTDITPNTLLSVAGQQYPTDGLHEWAANGTGGSTLVYQLANSTYLASPSEGNVVDLASAYRFEYAESGSVEGILEMANDQIAPVQYVTNNIDRNPTTGNNIWVNYNQIAASNAIQISGVAHTAFNTNNANGAIVGTGSTSSGYSLGDFYPNNATFSTNPGVTPQFNISGANPNGGQNAVQVAVSDAVPVQVFASAGGTAAANPWNATPQNAGFGQGNTTLSAPSDPTVATVGTPQFRQVYQSAASLNMPSGAINPRTGTAFGTGTWNSAGLANLTSQYVASTATIFVANPGTGLTQVDRTDSQWLLTTGRLQNGAAFNVTTRDVNSGTRNVSALEVGIDPTWAIGSNDDGNGNLANGGTTQVTIGSGLRFSNKTAGGNELRPTVQTNRFAVGTLSINDATNNTLTTNTNPIRALSYSDSTDGSAPYVPANYFTIAGINTSNSTFAGTSYASINPAGQQYTIFQNEQFVTVNAPGGATNASTGVPAIQGDDSSNDVATLLNNTISSVAAYNGTNPASAASGLLSQGYIIPQLMSVQKAQNGLNIAGSASQIKPNPSYNASLSSTAAFGTLVTALTMGAPASVTAGSSSSVYGGNSLVGGGPAGFATTGQIKLTSASNNAGGPGAAGNYLLGNFNQSGVRDFYSSVVLAQQAQLALDTSGAGNSGFTGLANNTSIATPTVPALTAMTNFIGGTGATKGDLIALGDLNGDGAFNGRDLYPLAVDASLTDAGSRPIETTVAGATTFNVSGATINATAATFGNKIATSVLNKNVALDYLQATASAGQKNEASAVLTLSTAASVYPAGATPTGTTDSVSGYNQFTFDPNGVNAFNKSDVNSDGVVDFNDAVDVSNLSGKSYMNLSDSLLSSEPTPVTGAPELANLVLAQQMDTNTSIGLTDLAVINTALTGSHLTTNWYAYQVTKTGPGTISWQGSAGSVVNVNSGASMQISAGTVQVVSAIDPFTDNNTNKPSTNASTGSSLAMTVTTGGTLEYTPLSATGIQLDRLSSLNIAGGTVLLDSSTHANRMVLVTGLLAVNGQLDLGNNDLVVHNGSIGTIAAAVKAAYANGLWTGSGISSKAAATDPTHLTALAVVQDSTNGSPTGPVFLSSFDGVPVVASDVLLKYTYYGDANLDGKIDGTDYARIDNGFSNHLTGWYNGDFNYDGIVDGSDYALIDNSFNTQGASLAASISDPTVQIAAEIAPSAGTSAVPEPTTLGLLGIGVGSLLGRRRRRA